ncbi:Ig-like domain repeat protein, partial [Candidatus Sumerlaeota bacterium]|nr:Ig-like domain repeat protein [Candidatus Sumerlaeota bacterium]
VGVYALDTNGQAAYTTSALAVGSHAVLAVYSSGQAEVGGSSDTLTQVVNSALTEMSLKSELNPSQWLDATTFTVQLSSSAPVTFAGVVVFVADGVTTLGSVPVNPNGTASLTTDQLTVGTHPIMAIFISSDPTAANCSDSLDQEVQPRETATVVISSHNPSALSEEVTFTATVDSVPSGIGVITGTVTFFVGTTELGTVALDGNAQAQISTADLEVGNHDITAQYNGSATHLLSVSPVLVQVVQPRFGVDTNELDYGNILVGTQRTLSAVVSNAAGATEDLVVDNFAIVGAQSFAYALADGQATSVTVAPGETAEISVTFTPPYSGQFVAELTMTTTDPSAPNASVALTGRGNEGPTIQITSSITAKQGGTSVTLNVAVVSDTEDDDWLLNLVHDELTSGLSLDLEITSGTGTVSATFHADDTVEPGTYSTVLTVTDSDGNASSATLNMIVELAMLEDWYFAEGSTVDAQTWLLLINPSTTESVQVELTVFFEATDTDAGRDPLVLYYNLAPRARTTKNINFELSSNGITEPVNFGMQVLSLSHMPIYAERAMYTLDNGYYRLSGHDSIGVNMLNERWFIAEGTTSTGRDTYLLFCNPNDEDCEIQLDLLDQNGANVTAQLVCPAQRRITADIRQDYMPSNNFGAAATSTNGVSFIMERTMTKRVDVAGDGRLSRYWSHNVPAKTATANTWYFAEGSTHSAFDTFITLSNPTSDSVVCNLRFILQGESPVAKQLTLPALSRVTVNVERDYPNEMTDKAGFAIEVITPGGEGIAAERPMYFTASGWERTAGTVVGGVPQPRTGWFLPEGAVYGPSGFQCFFVIGNPMPEDANVRVTFALPEGQDPVVNMFTVPANESLVIPAHNYFTGPNTVSFATIVESLNNVPLVVERTMYFYNRNGAHASNGLPFDVTPEQ